MSELIITIVSPLAATYTSLDQCKTCYTLRNLNEKNFRESKLASMATLRAYVTVNSLTEDEFKEALEKLNKAAEICCNVEKPDDNCLKTNQESLNYTLNLFFKRLESPQTKRKLGL